MMRILFIALIVFAFTIPGFADVVELAPTADASVYENHPSTNYGSYPELDWGRIGGDIMYALIVFDGLSGYLGLTLNSATLSIYIIQGQDSEDNYLRRVIDEWDENNVTWNNRPDNTTQGELEFIAYPFDEWLDLDVTAFVQDWLDTTYPNYGLCFLRVDGLSGWWSFHSREYSDPDYRPKLTLDFPSPVESASLGAVKAAFR